MCTYEIFKTPNLIENYILHCPYKDIKEMFPEKKTTGKVHVYRFTVKLSHSERYEFDARLRLNNLKYIDDVDAIQGALMKIGRTDVRLLVKGFDDNKYVLLHCRYHNEEEKLRVQDLISKLK